MGSGAQFAAQDGALVALFEAALCREPPSFADVQPYLSPMGNGDVRTESDRSLQLTIDTFGQPGSV